MTITERIQQYVQKLPMPFQAEVLDFVEYLLTKTEQGAVLKEDRHWSSFSLARAMRGMEDETTPTYTTADLKVMFS